MKYIVSDPNILSGKYVLKGTRISLARIVFLLQQGYTIEAIHQEYPHVNIKLIAGAVSELVKILDNKEHATKFF